MTDERPRLNRHAVLVGALTVIDEAGLDACTMRAVAAELGVEAMSLYWHIPGKEALLDGVVEVVLLEVAAETREIDDWREGLETFAVTFREVILRHRNVVTLLASRPFAAYAAAARMAETGLERLEAAGFPRPVAIRAARLISRYVVGFTLAEAGDAHHTTAPPTTSLALGDLLAQVATDDPGEFFLFGLATLLDGLAVRLNRPA